MKTPEQKLVSKVQRIINMAVELGATGTDTPQNKVKLDEIIYALLRDNLISNTNKKERV